jgi:hypothetical protein
MPETGKLLVGRMPVTGDSYRPLVRNPVHPVDISHVYWFIPEDLKILIKLLVKPIFWLIR